jgi:hypothetical protein
MAHQIRKTVKKFPVHRINQGNPLLINHGKVNPSPKYKYTAAIPF